MVGRISLVACLGLVAGLNAHQTTDSFRNEARGAESQHHSRDVPVSDQSYDYIVVGGGTSGIVTAQRLVETGKTVLLLERGGPSYYSTGGSPTVPWNDTTTAYDIPGYFYELLLSGLGSLCTDVPELAGCVLGGGSAVNGLQFIRPPKTDFENWPEGWRWEDGLDAAADRVYQREPGTTMPSSDGKFYDNAVYDVMSEELADMGWSKVDSNKEPDRKTKTYAPPAVQVINGRRSGPAISYLPLAQGKPNFTLKLRTKVIRAVRTNSTVTGVETQSESGERLVYPVTPGSGKVIFAAGTMSTPRLLFHSGIGPRDQIEMARLSPDNVTLPPEEAWIESPVGVVRDHTLYLMEFEVKGGLDALSLADFANPSQENIDLFAKGAGPLTQASRLNTFTSVEDGTGHKRYFVTHWTSVAENSVFGSMQMTHGSTSTGRLGLTAEGNTVWTQSPWLQTEGDKEALVVAIDELLAMSRKESSRLVWIGYGGENATGADIVENVAAQSGVHMTGTAIIGTDDGSKGGKAVVDLDTKVYGTDNLFVVDASMHADLPTGNTVAIVMVAAERAVEKIIALG
ncbi:hypothetical protein PpBr36_07515 [Pyricularia pennisetigena]|uniref:hypothetical protein n=1 Tax=Pyricularia pennisetigena TaxID=1578925 RepID=UPI0011545A70|nr:hypothetical protein PpBr36_07515 [Pyricularia pennisetigena]TLS25085.1 hypothetical protein PpBr36_07515 [Pyricularia pennisetigena]